MKQRLTCTLRLAASFFGAIATVGLAVGGPPSAQPQIGVCTGCTPDGGGLATAFNPDTNALLTAFVDLGPGYCFDTWDASNPCYEFACTSFLYVGTNNLPAESRALTTWYGYPDGSEADRNTMQLPSAKNALTLSGWVNCGRLISLNASLPDVGTVTVWASCSECSNE